MGEKKESPFTDPNLKEQMEKIFSRYFKKLCCYANTIVKNEQISQDIVTEAFTKFLESRPQLRKTGEQAILSYLCASIWHISLNWIRDQKSHQFLPLDNELNEDTEDETSFADTLPDPSQNTEESVIHQELREHVYKIIDQLPPKQRECARWHYIKDLTYTETAKKMNISSGAARILGMRATENLRDLIGKDPYFKELGG